MVIKVFKSEKCLIIAVDVTACHRPGVKNLRELVITGLSKIVCTQYTILNKKNQGLISALNFLVVVVRKALYCKLNILGCISVSNQRHRKEEV